MVGCWGYGCSIGFGEWDVLMICRYEHLCGCGCLHSVANLMYMIRLLAAVYGGSL
jgi:hypothetical protein